MQLIHDDVLPVHDETVIRRNVGMRSTQLRRRRRVRRAAVPVVGVALLVVVVLVAGGVPTGLRTTGPPVPPANEGPSGQLPPADDGISGSVPVSTTTTPRGESREKATTSPDRPSPGRPTAPPARMAYSDFDQLHEIRTDGSGLRPLGVMGGYSPAWSPSGSSLAFRETDKVTLQHRIVVLDLRSGERWTVPEPKETVAEDPAWSPDGRSIAFQRRHLFQSWPTVPETSIWVVDVATRATREVGPGETPAWSPDGRILFQRAGSLWVMAADGSNVVAVPDSNGLYTPTWSPDGRWIAAHDMGKVVLLRPDGRDRHVLVEGSQPAWFPDSGELAYVLDYTGGIWSIRLDSGGRRKLVEGGYSPALVAG